MKTKYNIILYYIIIIIYHICKVVIKKSRPKWTALIISVIPRCRRAAASGLSHALYPYSDFPAELPERLFKTPEGRLVALAGGEHINRDFPAVVNRYRDFLVVAGVFKGVRPSLIIYIYIIIL